MDLVPPHVPAPEDAGDHHVEVDSSDVRPPLAGTSSEPEAGGLASTRGSSPELPADERQSHDPFRDSVLHELCKKASITQELLEACLQRHPEAATQQNSFGQNPLLLLCRNSAVTPELLEAYLQRHPEAAMQQNSFGQNPLLLLCGNSAVTPELLEVYLQRHPEAATQQISCGQNPLLLLCGSSAVTPELLEAYLQRCPEAAIEQDKFGKNPFHFLCENSAVTPELLEVYLQRHPEAAATHQFDVGAIGSNGAHQRLQKCWTPEFGRVYSRGLQGAVPNSFVIFLLGSPSVVCKEQLDALLLPVSSRSFHDDLEDLLFHDPDLMQPDVQVVRDCVMSRSVQTSQERVHCKFWVEAPCPPHTKVEVDESDDESQLTERSYQINAKIVQGLEPRAEKRLKRMRWLRGSARARFPKEEGKLVRASMWACAVPDVTSDEMVQALSTTRSDEALTSLFAIAVIEEAWKSVKTAHRVDLALTITMLAALSHAALAIRGDDGETNVPYTTIVMAFLMSAKKISEELWQLGRALKEARNCALTEAFCEYFLSVGTLVDWGYALILTAGTRSMVGYRGAPEEKLAIGLCCTASWFQLLYAARGIYAFGPRFLPIFFAIRDTGPFNMVVCVFYFAVTHAYFVVSPRVEPWGPFYAAVILMWRLLFVGDADLFELEGVDATFMKDGDTWSPQDPPPSDSFVGTQVVFMLTTLSGCVILMNLFVGVLGQNFEIHEDRSLEHFQRARSHVILFYKRGPWRFVKNSICKCCRRPKLDPVEQHRPNFLRERAAGTEGGPDRKVLWIFSREHGDAGEEDRSTRSAVDRKIARISTKIDEKSRETKKMISALDKKVDAVLDMLAKRFPDASH